MQYTRESGTKFDLNFRNLGKELNRVNFDISDNIVSLYISNFFTTDRELFDLWLYLSRFISNKLEENTNFDWSIDSLDDDTFVNIEFTNNNTMGGVDVGEKLLEMKVIYPTNYKKPYGDSLIFALTVKDVEYLTNTIKEYRTNKSIEREKENLDDIKLMVKQPNGAHICVPLSKVEEYTKKQKNKFCDIACDELYNEDWDKLVFAFIENGNGSHALAQKILNKSFAYCGHIMDYLAVYKYIDTDENNWKCLITKEEFERIIADRK